MTKVSYRWWGESESSQIIQRPVKRIIHWQKLIVRWGECIAVAQLVPYFHHYYIHDYNFWHQYQLPCTDVDDHVSSNLKHSVSRHVLTSVTVMMQDFPESSLYAFLFSHSYRHLFQLFFSHVMTTECVFLSHLLICDIFCAFFCHSFSSDSYSFSVFFCDKFPIFNHVKKIKRIVTPGCVDKINRMWLHI